MIRFMHFLRNRRATVTLMAATMAPVLVGVAGLVTEYGNALMTKVKMQRIADAAAYSGALAYSSAGTIDAMNAAISRVATLNGITADQAVGSIVTSPSGNGNNAVRVTATSSIPLGLTQLLGTADAVSVSASAFVELRTSGRGCILGLLGTAGGAAYSVKQDGGSTVTGTNCLVASRNAVSITGGATMNVKGVYAAGAVSITGGSTVTTTPTANNVVANYAGSIVDPVASNGAVQSAFTNLSSLSGSVANPTTPSSSVNLTFNWSPSGPSDPTYPYYSGTGGVYNTGTLPCNSGSYAINRITVSGGVSVSIAATAGCNYTVASGINVSGTRLVISNTANSWYINGGVVVGGSYTLTLNGSTIWIGGGINVGGSSTLNLANSSTIYVNGGITTAGSSTNNLVANVYRVAGSVNMAGTVNWQTSGTAPSTQFFSPVTLGSGGGTFTFGDGTYTFNGNVVLSSGPTYFGNTQLSINGNLTVSSGASLCGTPSPCSATTSRITIIDNGTNTFAGGSITNIQAPAAGAAYGIPGIAIAGNYVSATTTYAQSFTGGTSGTWSGVLYFPNSSVQFAGGAGASGPGCLEIIGNVVYFSGGSSTASVCSGFGAPIGAATALLVR